MMKKTLMTVFISGTVLLTGCVGNQIKNVNSYTKMTLPPADIMPSENAMSGNKTKVVIFNPTENDVELAEAAKIGHSIATSLEKHIAVTGSELVDRSLAEKLRKEIQLAEIKASSTYKGPEIADYAITGTVSSANAGVRYIKENSWQDGEGVWHHTPAKCIYTANVSANMRIYELPGLSFAKAINLEDSASVSEETKYRNCRFSNDAKESLLRQASIKSVKSARIEFQNYFAPKAYVLERRQKENTSIFKISHGNDLGFVADSDIKIYHLEESTNPLTDETTTEEYLVTEGTVSNQVGQNYAWVFVEDEEKASNIKLGDYEKVLYDKGMFESLTDFF